VSAINSPVDYASAPTLGDARVKHPLAGECSSCAHSGDTRMPPVTTSWSIARSTAGLEDDAAVIEQVGVVGNLEAHPGTRVTRLKLFNQRPEGSAGFRNRPLDRIASSSCVRSFRPVLYEAAHWHCSCSNFALVT
jgi:hypothetical protein